MLVLIDISFHSKKKKKKNLIVTHSYLCDHDNYEQREHQKHSLGLGMITNGNKEDENSKQITIY